MRGGDAPGREYLEADASGDLSGRIRQECGPAELRDGGFAWSDPDFGTYPLMLDPPPPLPLTCRVVRLIGDAAILARKVEIPFAKVVAPVDRWWTSDSRGSIDVAIGKTGAPISSTSGSAGEPRNTSSSRDEPVQESHHFSMS